LFRLPHIAAHYESDFPSALAALRDVESIAIRRGDVGVLWTTKVQIAQLAMLDGEFQLCGRLVDEIAEAQKMPTAAQLANGQASEQEPNGPAGPLQGPIRLLFMILFSIYHAHVTGQVKLARKALKDVHVLLDSTEESQEEMYGYFTVNVRPPPVLFPLLTLI
jgi:hypothetical protein